MKITKKQRTAIIKTARKELDEWTYLCIALSSAIQKTLNVNCYSDTDDVQKYFPKFERSTAIRYFHGRDQYAWWKKTDKHNRLRFLRYLLTGKLPKVRK